MRAMLVRSLLPAGSLCAAPGVGGTEGGMWIRQRALRPVLCVYKGERRATRANLRDTTLLCRCPFFPVPLARGTAIRMVRTTPASEGAITPRLDNGSARRRLLRPATGTFHRRRSRGSFWVSRRRLAPTAGSLRSRRAVLSSLNAVALFGCACQRITHVGWNASGARL